MTVGSLFAGIGGFDLAADRVGWEVKWQVEIDPFCRRVLEKHWPHVRRYEDVREVHARGNGYLYTCQEPGQCEDCIDPVDIICGGFPCQDISSAGAKAGLDGKQSGLWFEMARVVRELRPRYVVVENVADLLARGMGRVLGSLAAIGYDAEWDSIQAAAIGAPHGRDRVWLVAYRAEDVSNATGAVETARPRRWTRQGLDFERWRADARQRAGWETEPAICRVADGVSPGLDNARLAALGNSIVPQIAEWIFRQIQAAEEGVSA